MGLSTRGIAIVICCLGLACSPDARTEVVVVTDSDLSIPDQIDRIEYEVINPAGDPQPAFADIRGAVDLPAVLGLVYEGGDLGPFQVNAVARVSGAETIRRTHRFFFVRGQTLVLRIDLLRSCIGSSCGTGETCAAEGCRPIDVGEAELEPWSGSPPRLDSGMPPADASDTGPGDAGCVLDAQCDDLIACTVDTCTGGVCTNRPDDTTCSMGDVCDAEGGCGGRPCDDNPDCDDGMFCNGPERCVSMRCTTGPMPGCDDGIACTNDRCDDVMSACVNLPDVTACDDGIACTTDTCESATGCVNVPNDAMCDDTFACTTDACVAGTGCRSTADDVACAAGEFCALGSGCVAGPTFTEVYTGTLSVDCTPCHTRGMPAGGLSFADQPAAYGQLVGVAARCGVGNTRVIARDASNSLLWRKVAGVDLCGARMPNGRAAISDAKIDQIRDWINAGAANN